MRGTPATSERSGLTLKHSLRLLIVVALAVAAAFSIVLGLSWRHEAARLEERQQESSLRSAEIARVLLNRRIERGHLLIQALAESRTLQESLAALSASRLERVLREFNKNTKPTHIAVLDASGELLAASSPLAWLAFEREHLGPGSTDAHTRAGVVAGDLSAIIDQPVMASGRRLGTVRATVQIGRIFLSETSDDLNVPLALLDRDRVVHHSFPEEPPLARPGYPRRRSADFDIAYLRVEAFPQDEIWIAAGESRAPLRTAQHRFLSLVATLGIGGLLLVLLSVGSFLLVGHRRERRLVSQRDAAIDRSRGLSDRLDHLAAVVHDIKAPVAGIQLRCEGLAEDMNGGDTRSALFQVVETCEKLSLYLVNVLTAAQAEEGTIKARRDVILVPGLLEEVVEHATALAERKGIHLLVSANSSLAPMSGDAGLLERALINLAVNAISATPEGGEVELFAEIMEGDLVMGVRDSGPGFTVFDPKEAFSRSRVIVKDASIKAGSTGLGLFIVARIAEAHGGYCQAINRDSGGGEVRIVLPH